MVNATIEVNEKAITNVGKSKTREINLIFVIVVHLSSQPNISSMHYTIFKFLS